MIAANMLVIRKGGVAHYLSHWKATSRPAQAYHSNRSIARVDSQKALIGRLRTYHGCLESVVAKESAS